MFRRINVFQVYYFRSEQHIVVIHIHIYISYYQHNLLSLFSVLHIRYTLAHAYTYVHCMCNLTSVYFTVIIHVSKVNKLGLGVSSISPDVNFNYKSFEMDEK